jgi:hypothetical protein
MKGSFEERIQTYKKLEALLEKFFSVANFCGPKCLTQEHSLFSKYSEKYPQIPKDIPGFMGCCIQTQYNFKESIYKIHQDNITKFLQLRKEKSIDETSGRENTCKYHSKEGCIITELKPPVCVSFICKDFREYLIKEHNIHFENDSIQTNLEHLIIKSPGKIDGQYKHIELKLMRAINRIEGSDKQKDPITIY